MQSDQIKLAADAILAKVPVGYGMTREEAEIYAAAALAAQTQQGVEELRRLDDALGNFINAYGDPYEPAEDYEAETERNIKELSDAYNGAYVAGIFSGRSALVDVPAVESEPVGEQWCAYEDGHQHTSWYPDGYGDRAGWAALAKRNPEKYQVVTRPVYAHPPRSLSNEGSEVVAAAQRYVDSVSHDPGARASDKAWRAHDKEKQDAFDALRAALSTRKGSSEGDGSATITKGSADDQR